MKEFDRLKIELTNAITKSLAGAKRLQLESARDYAVDFAKTGDEDKKRQFEICESRAFGYENSIEMAQNVCRDFKLSETK